MAYILRGIQIKFPQPNNILKISNKGIKTSSQKGNHLIMIKVLLPEKLSKEERKELEKIREKKAEKHI